MNKNLLENLQQACKIITEGYQLQTGNSNIQFDVLQLSDIQCSKQCS